MTERRVLVVSHPCVVPENQVVYRALRSRGWDPLMVIPHRWSHTYAEQPFSSVPLPGLEGRIRHRRVVRAGDPAKHFYFPPLGRLVSSLAPPVAFVEAECFAVVALQMASTLRRLGVSYGVQADENLDRPLPPPVRVARRFVLRNAAFVAARSPRAAELVRQWGARGAVDLVPHALPDWQMDREPAPRGSVFTVGYAGRLVEEKGLFDLVEAVRALDGSVRLLLVGDGPLRAALQDRSTGGLRIDIRTAADQAEMPALYREMDVLVLPSRTTPTWAEQFGRVLPEALLCGVPVIGSNSGEIPWVIGSTGGGWTFPEGDVEALARLLAEVRGSPGEAAARARVGRKAAIDLFGADAAAAALARLLDASAPRPRLPAPPV